MRWLSLIIAMQTLCASGCDGCEKEKPKEAAIPKPAGEGAIRIVVDSELAGELSPSSSPISLDDVLPERYRDRSTWARIDAVATTGQRSAASQRSKLDSLTLRLEPGEGGMTFVVARKGGTTVSVLPEVRAIEITTIAEQRRHVPAPKPEPSFELRMGGEATAIPWSEVRDLPRRRHKGEKRAGIEFVDLLRKRGLDPSKVEAVEFHGEDGELRIAGTELQSADHSVQLRLNRANMIRVTHSVKGPESKRGKHQRVGGVRGLDKVLVTRH